jgi:primosomal protein N' (replication factor Y)
MLNDATTPPKIMRFGEGDRVAVLLPLPLAGPYDYRLGLGQEAALGDFLRVPLGRRVAIGVLWGPGIGEVDEVKIKDVLGRLDAAPLPEISRRFIEWVSNYTLAAPGAVLKMAMSVPDALLPPARPQSDYVAAELQPAGLRMTAARRRVVEASWAPLPAVELARIAGTGVSVVKGLAELGALIPIAREARAAAVPDWQRTGPSLSPDQESVAGQLRNMIGAGFAVAALEGVTGAGKTEVYFEAIAATLAQGRQALVLLPEIALSAQWLERFVARFGAPPHAWHSDLTPARRREVWRDVAAGRARVVVGARSALFLPFTDLGLLTVDEEHDASYKQDEGVCYHARDMAVVRARLADIPIILASATPSLETQANILAGRYRALHLPARHGGATLPAVSIVDLRATPPARRAWLAPPLIDAVAETLGAGEQVLLFLNRRGYAPLTLCRACGHRMQCPNCSAWLVEHRQSARLQCHHCGLVVTVPPVCPECGAKDQMTPCGPGVERLAEEAIARFPEARTAIMASDTLTGPDAAARMVARMEAHEIDLLIGTQVVAKGHHFPMLTLVGVVDADLGLAGGDLRAAERTFQLLTQVAGRAGRAERPGRVLLQTFEPQHPVIAALASGDAARFYAAEAAERRAAGMPPFGRLAALIVSGPDAARVERTAAELARAAPHGEGIEVLGPAPAPLAFLRGRHRRRLLLKTDRRMALQELLRHWLGAVDPGAGVRIQIDVDPYSFV